MTCLLVTVHWLDHRYHGLLGRDGTPEWPPSPFRLFEALVSGVARRDGLESPVGESLRWLQTLAPPTIITPRALPGQVVTYFVPNNDGDKKPDRQDRLKGKKFCPTLILDSPEVHYVWSIERNDAAQAQLVCKAAGYLTCLGWGTDAAYSEGRLVSRDEAGKLLGTCWRPRLGVRQDRGLLRVPIFNGETGENSLDDLRHAHQSALMRVEPEPAKPLRPVEKPKVFGRVFYESKDNVLGRPFAAFSLLKLDAGGFRDFDPARRSRALAGMMRHVAQAAARQAGWPDAKIKAFVLGHGESPNAARHTPVEGSRRFAYLPLPSIEPRGSGKPSVVGRIRRVLVTSFADDCESEISWARRALSNQVLVEEDSREGEAVALLSLIPETDSVLRNYTQRRDSWTTVTPVVLPGYDDPDHLRRRAKNNTLTPEQQGRILERLSNRVDGLLRKAIRQAGFSDELAQHAEIEWRTVGFMPGTEFASHYGVPDYLKRFPRMHVRVAWRDNYSRPVEIPGPICIGGGRYFGLGLFVPEH